MPSGTDVDGQLPGAPLRIVCAVGPESTGKTTLCRALAEHFGWPWLAEYAREYLAGRSDYDEGDVQAIAEGQAVREARLLADIGSRTTGVDGAPGVLLDTDLLVILVWWRERFGTPPAWLERALRQQRARLYLLCRPDLPWQPDPLRESAGELDRLFRVYRALLIRRGLAYREVGGRGEARTAAAIAACASFFGDHPAELQGGART